MAQNQTPKNYVKMGIIAAAAVAVAAGGFLAIRATLGGRSVESSIAQVSPNAISAGDIKIAIIRMDAIQSNAKVLVDLRKQRERLELDLKATLEKTQKALEKEKAEIEKSQDVLSREALQKRVMEYQQKVSNFQRTVTEKAQAIDASFQKALVEIQDKHLDGIINGIIDKKNLSLVLDGRFARISPNAASALDITNDVVGALDKKITKFTMEKPKGF